ncbi:MAG: hypothetical protein ACR2GH_18045 [Pseudonocardia sp.]
MGLLDDINDFVQRTTATYTEPITHNHRDKSVQYMVDKAGFDSLGTLATQLSKACRSDPERVPHILADMENLAGDLHDKIGERQVQAQLGRIMDHAYDTAEASEHIQWVPTRMQGLPMPDGGWWENPRGTHDVRPGDPYLNCEGAMFAACNSLPKQGDKYLNPNPSKGNFWGDFDRHGNRRHDPYDQQPFQNGPAHPGTFYVDGNGDYH